MAKNKRKQDGRNRGEVAYDLDRYGNRIRKFVLTRFKRNGPILEPVWVETEGFKAETGFNKVRYNQKWSPFDNE